MADDPYVTYFTEKLWEMIPAVYRQEDAETRTLRGMIEIIAEQAAILRKSTDRLWEDSFIELCDDWAVPYLGDLVGTRLVPALLPGARRVDVAKTIYYRRRKGTPAVLEQLISDITHHRGTSWDGAVVEMFRRLGRAHHGLDGPVGAVSRLATPPGGWANLRDRHASSLVGTAFDEYSHTPDVRRHRGHNGRYGISKVAFHLFRIPAVRVQGVTPALSWRDKGFTFDPSGRDIPLFAPRFRQQHPKFPTGRERWDEWSAAREWEVEAPIRCLALAGRTERLVPNALSVGVGAADPPPEIPRDEVVAGCLSPFRLPLPTDKRVIVDPERGRFALRRVGPQEKLSATYHYGFPGALGAGAYPRPDVDRGDAPNHHLAGGGPIYASQIENSGVTQIDDSATYGPISNKDDIHDLTIQAANHQRPYVLLDEDWVLDTPSNADSKLVLNGLWLGAKSPQSVVLRGDYEEVVLQNVTLDPGGPTSDEPGVSDLPPVRLVIEGHVECLIIDASVTGPVCTRSGGVVETARIRDSILQSRDPTEPAIEIGTGSIELRRVSILGPARFHRLDASEALVTGLVHVTDVQTGCFRFGAARSGSRIPRPYESHRIDHLAGLFTSQRFGDPGYCQPGATAPAVLLRGAENGSEIGAFSDLRNPIKLDSLRAKIEEFMPFGLVPIFIGET